MRQPAKTFQDLIVWQKAHQFVLSIYQFTNHTILDFGFWILDFGAIPMHKCTDETLIYDFGAIPMHKCTDACFSDNPKSKI